MSSSELVPLLGEIRDQLQTHRRCPRKDDRWEREPQRRNRGADGSSEADRDREERSKVGPMRTSCNCSICGHEGYWGRFGGHRALYIRDSSNYSTPFSRVGWVCKTCLKNIEEGTPLQ